MATFSINISQITESTAYPLTGDLTDIYFTDLLQRLKDNNTGDIEPVDIRDSILSIWSSTPFKLTKSTHSNIEYIGFDSLNPLDNDVKDKKILIGKRSNSFGDTLNDDLLKSDSDLFFYNTKPDTSQQITTKINLLAGLSFSNSTFIQSQVISGFTSSSFDFINNSGFINIDKDTRIDTLKLPSGASANNGNVLIRKGDQPLPYAVWDNIKIQIPSNIGSIGTELNIFGDTIKVNGYDLDFTDARRSPIEIGDIKFGETFSRININDMLRRMIYKYLPVTTSLKILPPFSSGIVELDTRPLAVLEYTVNKKTNNTGFITLVNMLPNFLPPITTLNYSTLVGTASSLIGNPINKDGITFSVTVSDSITTSISSVNIKGVIPYFWGLLNVPLDNISLRTLNKIIEEKGNKTINVNGKGTLFFLYDSIYDPLTKITSNGVNLIAQFTTGTIVLSSDVSWRNKQFRFYFLQNFSSQFNISYNFEY